MNERCENDELAWKTVLREAEKNARLFTSNELTEHIRRKHVSQGVSLFYVDPDYPDQLTEERPNGTFRRRPLSDDLSGDD